MFGPTTGGKSYGPGKGSHFVRGLYVETLVGSADATLGRADGVLSTVGAHTVPTPAQSRGDGPNRSTTPPGRGPMQQGSFLDRLSDRHCSRPSKREREI